MKQTILYTLFGVIFVVGFILGIISNELNNETREIQTEDHNHVTDLPHQHGHVHHEKVEVDWEPVPSVEIEVLTDPKAGYNLHIKTENFVFSPEGASSENVQGQGHAHLYIDGTKITRIYGEWFHIPELSAGEHTIMVSLNANDHSDLAINGKNIQSMTTVIVNE